MHILVVIPGAGAPRRRPGTQHLDMLVLGPGSPKSRTRNFSGRDDSLEWAA